MTISPSRRTNPFHYGYPGYRSFRIYLPLCHIAEQIFSIHGAITFGYEVAFAESIEKLADNIKEVRPTGFFGVPRIWEKFHEGLSTKLGQATGVKAKLVSWARSVATKNYECVNDGKFRSPKLLAQYVLANKLIYSKVKEALGLDECRYFISGAAPIAKEVLASMQSLDIPVWEVYGQSEDVGQQHLITAAKHVSGLLALRSPVSQLKSLRTMKS